MALKDRARGAREDARDPGGEAAAADGHMQSSSPLVVVGLGASAGGITALERFFDAMPSDSGGAFVIVVHLDPTHASSIAEILGRHTAMPVAEAVNGRPLERDHVYVIAPNSILKIEGNTLIVFPPPEPRGFRMPIDHFFASLGEDRRQRAVGILLSGTGSDGTSGLRAIKSSGGLTMAQDPATADQAGMVRSAIEMGVVDHVLAIEQMPQHIIQYARHAYTNDDEDPMKPEAVKDDSDLSGILAVLRTRVRLDFSSYRKGTIRRRMQRRMGIRQIETIPEYLSLLREDPVEVQLLAADMLIGVTGFFREREAWEKLEELVIRPLVASKSPEEPIRVWVPACASGEEAYSLTMMIFRHLEEAQKICPVQIFATDIDHSALEHARMGLYPESIAADVGANYLQRYFLKEGDRYKVVKVIRDAIVFAAQNLITDPPYSKLDLISCRNLLIYLEPDRQKRLLSLFHFALREGGFLFLGNSETIGQQIEQFAPISRKWRIYRRTGSIQLHQLDLTVRDASFGLRRPPTTHAEAQGERAIRHAEQAVLRRFSPACAIVDRQHEIRFLFGPTDRFLSQPEGALTSNVFEWCKGSLRTKLRSALHRLWERSDGVETMVIRSREDGRAVRLTVEQIRETRDLQGMALVSFQEATASIEPEPNLAETESSVVQKLEEELRETRNDLQTTIEELQTSNEEFKAVNEEALSINEELQSTNEELETSKEELQSLNEELLTVNFQLQTKLGELEQRNDDLDNLLRSTDLAAIFLDRQFRIKWFSPAMTSLLSLLPTDIGRPLSDFAARFTDPDLLTESEAVLKDLVPVTREIQTHDGRWYLRRLLPYRTRTDRIDGIVMTFTDVTASRAAEMELKERTEALETRVQQRTALLQLLYDIAGEANQAPSVAEAVLAVIKLVAVNGGWEIGHAWQVDESSGLVVPLDQWYVAPGEDFSEFNAATMRTTLGPGEGLIRRTLAKGETIWVDVEQEHFVRGDLAAAGIKSGVTIPILVKGRAVAALEFYSRSEKVKPGHRFLSSLKNVGLHLGYVIERQQLEKYIADQSDRERRTVGQELHDTVGQSLAAMAMMTRDLLQDLQAAKAPHAIKAARIQDGIESTKDELRKVIRGMLPVELDGTGLLNALIDFSERSSVDGTVCRFVSEDPGRLGIDDGFVGAQLFRIAQEAVRNALKHARASEVVISLRAPDGRVELEVADNGTGEWKGSTGGSGMRIMRYRADLIGGRIQVSIERGKGTRVACVVQRRPKRPSVRDAG
ncbi:MAG TPA: chemotaxis protein CheB [Candidatus Polarisedimenticolaceae bacterium]|nr:chemotaxis protein CheB [Candidatus Polarisedimenticolaceae bacterium]